VRTTSAPIPISVKLAPNVPDIARIAAAVVEAGADAITAINTMPGMVIDAESGQPVLSSRVGASAARRSSRLRCAPSMRSLRRPRADHWHGRRDDRPRRRRDVDGRRDGGRRRLAVWYRGVDAFARINEELAAFMAQHAIVSVAELRGVARRSTQLSSLARSAEPNA